MIKVIERTWTPACAVVPQERGPEFIAPIDDAGWSAGVGFYRGFFSSFRIRAEKDVWFHFPLPAPIERDGQSLALGTVSLLWEPLDGIRITWLVLQHGGMERLPLTERLEDPTFESVPFEPPEKWREYYPAAARRLSRIVLAPPLALQFGVQLCIQASASTDDGTIRFYGAGAEIVTTE